MATKVNIIKNMALMTAIALCMLAFASCKDKNPPNITMTVPPTNKVIFYMAGSGKITINWGDGTIKTKRLRAYKYSYNFFRYRHRFIHSYSNSSAHTIKISGSNITHLATSSFTEDGLMTNNLTSLDVSGATALTALMCYDSQLTELDLRNNTALIYLNCSNNQLTELDLNANAALIDLSCSNNQLTKLDLSANIALTELHCPHNQIMELDLSANTALRYLNCDSNNLSTEALNALFKTLYNNPKHNWIVIANNPGTDNCDIRIAEEKGWTVFTSGEGMFVIMYEE